MILLTLVAIMLLGITAAMAGLSGLAAPASSRRRTT